MNTGATNTVITSDSMNSLQGAGPQVGSKMLRSMLAASPPQQQKQILGERLFPLIKKQKYEYAAKITGMLLEMDSSELLLLLESPESLAAKVEEAAQILELSKAKVGSGAGGRIGSKDTLHTDYLSAEVAVSCKEGDSTEEDFEGVKIFFFESRLVLSERDALQSMSNKR